MAASDLPNMQNMTDAASPEPLLPELVERQVSLTPDRIAVVCGAQAHTFAAVNESANRLAHVLLARGIRPEDRVAVAVSRSLAAVVAPLAVMKAGAAYLPLEVTVPRTRLLSMLDDAKPAVVIVDAEAQRELRVNCSRLALDDAEVQQALAAAPVTNPGAADRRGPLTARSAAYAIYTSGSTGMPKGVLVEHGSLAWLLHALRSRLGDAAAHRHAALTATTFDVSIGELLAPLCAGGCVILADREQIRDPGRLRRLIADHAVTSVIATPSHWGELLEGESDGFAVQRLVSTGEALPVALGKRLLEHATEAWNLYGPTETTVWATAHRITEADCRGDGTISIGHPLDHCRATVLDHDLLPVDVGAVGELYLGGAGVARGYLNRPSLTAVSFVPDPGGPRGAVMYRTGDRVRQCADGSLVFVDRVDRQVKLRGFRIELGEIEAVLQRDPRVEDALVAVDGSGADRRLIGYVVPRREADATRAAVEDWRDLHESVYAEADASAAPDFNIAGWRSSYTGDPMAPEQVRMWVDETVERLRRFAPTAVLEVGCGTGLLLARLAADTRRYVGVDFSAEVIAGLQQYVAGRPDLAHVRVDQKAAHELSFLEDESVDLVVINSVVQYFPNVDYLLDAIDQAARVTRLGGHIFIGDVRSLHLLEAFHTSVQLFQAPDDLPQAELRARVAYAMRHEEQLLIAPALFDELASRHQKLGAADVQLKAGKYENENSLFRYDVVLTVGQKSAPAEPECWLEWGGGGEWQRELRELLRHQRDRAVGVRAIPDRRAGPAVAAVRQLHDAADGPVAATIRARCGRVDGEQPDAIIRLARELGTTVAWRRFGSDAVYDVVFNQRRQPASGDPPAPPSYYRRYTNMHVDVDGAFGSELRRSLRDVLPEHMVPSTIVVLDALPLTATGKLDLHALPRPVSIRSAAVQPPRTPAEAALCELFADVLGIDRVGIDDDFFELGGHSLLATRLLNRLRSKFAVDVPLRTLFDSKSVAELARHISF
jgi:pristinamycin I synthase 3 and 4